MPLAAFQRGTGERVHGGETGVVYSNVGQLVFQRAPRLGADASLFAACKIAADTLAFTLVFSSIDTGQHVPGSRHRLGCAGDIVAVYPVGEPVKKATLANSFCRQLLTLFRDAGWHVGEGGDWPGLLAGPAHSALNPSGIPHANHVHISVARPRHHAS
ncbi:MAG: hypothetical protein H0U60_02350 [Blastocatellia bacterium]|nr:hypothetical protein [Blastocatellia bacterium]